MERYTNFEFNIVIILLLLCFCYLMDSLIFNFNHILIFFSRICTSISHDKRRVALELEPIFLLLLSPAIFFPSVY